MAVMTARDAEIEPALFGYQEKVHKVVLAGRGNVSGQETFSRLQGKVVSVHF